MSDPNLSNVDELQGPGGAVIANDESAFERLDGDTSNDRGQTDLTPDGAQPLATATGSNGVAIDTTFVSLQPPRSRIEAYFETRMAKLVRNTYKAKDHTHQVVIDIPADPAHAAALLRMHDRPINVRFMLEEEPPKPTPEELNAAADALLGEKPKDETMALPFKEGNGTPDAPVTEGNAASEREKHVEEDGDWEPLVRRIDEMLGDERFEFAVETLEGIKEWCLENEFCTEAQRQAVKNIEDGARG